MTVFSANDLTITVHEVRHHRNGVMGEGFYAVRFNHVDEDDGPRELIGVVFGLDPESPNGPWRRRTAVIDPTDATARFRGDEFAPVLYDAVMAADKDRSAYSWKCPTCADKGYLLNQTYGFAALPDGWVPVQRCDACLVFETDEDAAKDAAHQFRTTSGFFDGGDEPGDFAIQLPS